MRLLIFLCLLNISFNCWGQSIFQNDTICFSEAISEVIKVDDPQNTDKTKIKTKIFFDTTKLKTVVFINKAKEIFWLDDPLDSFYAFPHYRHTEPLPIFSTKVRGNKVYYKVHDSSNREMLQMSLIKNDTVTAYPYCIYLGMRPGGDTILIEYVKDTSIVYHKQNFSYYLFSCQQYPPNSEGFLHNYTFCVDKKYLIPVYIIDREYFITVDNKNDFQYKYMLTSCFYPQ